MADALQRAHDALADKVQPAEPDMRHPKIQALIGCRARREIELGLAEELLINPDYELDATDGDYWLPLHDKIVELQRKASPPVAPAAPVAPTDAHSDHWSDCATHNSPAYPAGACDCSPTPAMCRAAVKYMNGPDIYSKVPREVTDIEEGIYRAVYLAMLAAAPTAPAAAPAERPRQQPIRNADEWREIAALEDAAGGVVAAGALAAAPAEGAQWLPIESAPDDMAVHLFRVNGIAVEGFKDATGQMCVRNERHEWRQMRGKPSHWMPFPAAPTEAPNDQA